MDRYWPKEVDKEQRPQWVENLQHSRLVRHYYGHGESCEMNEIRLLLEFPLVTKMGRYLRGSVKLRTDPCSQSSHITRLMLKTATTVRHLLPGLNWAPELSQHSGRG